MLRAVLELLLTIAVILIARVVLTGVMKSLSSFSAGDYSEGNPPSGRTGQQSRRTAPEPQNAGLLHRDPICGTFVAESTPFRRQTGLQTFFYCSENCRQKHALAAK